MAALAVLATAMQGRAEHSEVRERPAPVEVWKGRLASADDALLRGDWKRGVVVAEALLEEMRDGITGGDGASTLLAGAALFRAIGKAGLGQNEAALWDFVIAQNLHPPLAAIDLSPYGPEANLLEAVRFDGPAWSEARRLPEIGEASGVRPPRRKSGSAPVYPYGKRSVCAEGPTEVRAVLNEQGRLELPRLTSALDPVLAYAVLDGIRDWRFEPATSGGVPVRVAFVVVVNFAMQGC